MCFFAGQKWVRLTDEVDWGVPVVASPVQNWVRMHEDNAFVAAVNPNTYDVRSVDALNQLILRGGANIGVGFTIDTLLYHPQAALWLAWVLTLNSTGGGTPVFTAKSKTIDFWDRRGPKRITGARVSRMTWTCAAQAQNSPVRVRIEGFGKDFADLGAALAEPAYAVFPALNTHYKFQHTKGGFKLGADAARTQYDAFQATWTNVLQPKFFEDQWISCLEWCGRDTGFTTGKAVSDSTDWNAYQALTEQAKAEVTFTNGTASVKLDWGSKAQISSYDPSFPLGDVAMESLGVTGIFNPAAGPGTQFAFTVTNPT